jgi:hypothetical protein
MLYAYCLLNALLSFPLTSMETAIRLMIWGIADFGLRISDCGLSFRVYYQLIKARINGKKKKGKKG